MHFSMDIEEEEALILRARALYTKPCHHVRALQALLSRHSSVYFLLTTLATSAPSSPEKEQVFLRFMRRHPRAADIEHLYRIRLDRLRASDSTISIEDIERLYASGEGGVLRALAGNPRTPVDMLGRLMDINTVKFARQIRHLACQNLHRRRRLQDEAAPPEQRP